MSNALVVGGTSGLGLEIARDLSEHHQVIISGRHNPHENWLEYHELDLAQGQAMSEAIGKFVMKLPEIEVFVFAPGFFQEGRVTDLSDEDIEQMIDVGSRSLVYLVREILNKQKKLNELVTITSTSEWTPRQKEPVYNFTKAAAAHFSNGLAEDGRIEKVLVAGPAGMDTPFWTDEQRASLGELMDPADVAEAIMNLRKGDYVYRHAKILRPDVRVEIDQERK